MDFAESDHVELKIVCFIALLIEFNLHFIQLDFDLLNLRKYQIKRELPYIFFPL